VPEHDLSLTDAEERCGTLAGPVAQRSGSVPEDEGRFDVPSARPQLDDPARARQGAIEGDRLRVRVQPAHQIALDDLSIGCEEICGTLIVPGVERVAPGADDAAR